MDIELVLYTLVKLRCNVVSSFFLSFIHLIRQFQRTYSHTNTVRDHIHTNTHSAHYAIMLCRYALNPMKTIKQTNGTIQFSQYLFCKMTCCIRWQACGLCIRRSICTKLLLSSSVVRSNNCCLMNQLSWWSFWNQPVLMDVNKLYQLERLTGLYGFELVSVKQTLHVWFCSVCVFFYSTLLLILLHSGVIGS